MRCHGKIAVVLVLLGLQLGQSACAISFDEADKLDRIEGSELLERARSAANSGQLSTAQSYISQARAKGAAPAQLKAAERVLAVAQAKADEVKRQEEARRQAELAAAQNRGGGGGAGRGDGANWISVEAECVAVICNVTNLTIGGGPGRFEPSFRAAYTGAIHKGYNGGLAGQYSYSFAIEKGGRRCIASGSFSANGSQGNIKINHYDDCRLSNVHAF